MYCGDLTVGTALIERAMITATTCIFANSIVTKWDQEYGSSRHYNIITDNSIQTFESFKVIRSKFSNMIYHTKSDGCTFEAVQVQLWNFSSTFQTYFVT